MNQAGFQLKPVPPFRLDLTVWALRRRPENAIDRWDGGTYRRALILNGRVCGIEAIQTGTLENPRLEVSASGDLPAPQLKASAAVAVQKMLGSNIHMEEFYRFAAGDPLLKPLIEEFRGFKPPRFSSLFEALLNSISCQQITLVLCIRMQNRLSEFRGPSINLSGQLIYALPDPQRLAKTEAEDLRRLGYSYNKARAILELASRINQGEVDLEKIAAMQDEPAIASLMQFRGVGRWTAEYSLLRGDGRTYLFPPGDSGAIRRLGIWLGPDKVKDAESIQKLLSPWKQYLGIIYYYLLLKRLSEKGYLHGPE